MLIRCQTVVSLLVFASCLECGLAQAVFGAEAARPVIPHNQSAPPGPALSPEQAMAKMQVPSGFQVELVASEPDVMNPVAMTIDERGRFWITESFEYPRQSAGPGRDRIKILEDTNHDGRVDRVAVFAEGLNIPSGIALGYGGVWVANSPDILFLQDTNGDDRADHSEVVVSGFGRTDTHELPNSLTWGPDGWLYGLNGVFNHSEVRQGDRTFKFTCTMFRIHPRTREFQLFAEGTSNPWGIAFDSEGSAFVSACVIDHLWHITENGYYHRQGGPYPPFTWKLGSIVEHTHQMAAYCGLTYFDSDAYPALYREKLYMGNIHGGCINVDHLRRSGATYVGEPDPDFLTANDAWFMPVVQKTGPDGSLYILDWYDRYHCYQDANRDPDGIDRGRGRLYRVRYGQTPRAEPFDLAKETTGQLIERLRSPNVYYRDLAQRLLAERGGDDARQQLEQLVRSANEPRKARLHALWSLIAAGPLAAPFHAELLRHEDPTFRAWGVRAAGNQQQLDPSLRETLISLADDSAADVRLQVAIAANKLADTDSLDLLCRVLSHADPDPLIPQIVWQNLLRHFEDRSNAVVARIEQLEAPTDGWNRLLPHAVNRLLADPANAPAVGGLLARTAQDGRWKSHADCLHTVHDTLINNPSWRTGPNGLSETLLPVIQQQLASTDGQPDSAKLQLAALLGDAPAREQLQGWLTKQRPDDASRMRQAFETLAALDDAQVLEAADRLLAQSHAYDRDTMASVLSSLGHMSDPRVAAVLLQRYESLPAELKPRIVELLTQRSAWARQMLQAIAEQRLTADALHINQIRRLQASTDKDLSAKVYQIWGTIRPGRNPQVEQAIARVRQLVGEQPGSAIRGHAVFRKTCGQCHQVYGEGEQVGPDVTRNGRASFDQLLSNVFDPNLVIGPDYQARTLITTDGRTLSGLLVEDSEQRVVLKLQGGKLETVARGDIEEFAVSPLSLMPEGWEKQLADQDLVDLMHFLTLDGPPTQSDVTRLPGTPELKSDDAAE